MTSQKPFRKSSLDSLFFDQLFWNPYLNELTPVFADTRYLVTIYAHTIQIDNRISCTYVHIVLIWFFFQRIFCFLLQNAINSYYNLYYDYWDLITKIWHGSTKWNPPFRMNLLKVIVESECIPPLAFRVEIRKNLSRH